MVRGVMHSSMYSQMNPDEKCDAGKRPLVNYSNQPLGVTVSSALRQDLDLPTAAMLL